MSLRRKQIIIIIMYVPSVKFGRRLISCANCIISGGNSLGWYLKNATDELLAGAKPVEVIETDETVSKTEFRKSWTDGEFKKGRIKQCMDNS